MADILECPICLDEIKVGRNCLTTECGHCFHTNCLMTSVAHNGFGCPYCRSVMAEEVIEEEDDSDNEYEEEDTIYQEDETNEETLRGFRLFFNNINGEEPYEEDAEAEHTMLTGRELRRLVSQEEQQAVPDIDFITQKLVEQGVTMKQLASALLASHEEYICNDTVQRIDDDLFGKVRVIISNFSDVSE